MLVASTEVIAKFHLKYLGGAGAREGGGGECPPRKLSPIFYSSC